MTEPLVEEEHEVARGKAAQTPFVLIVAVALTIGALFALVLTIVLLAGWLG